MGELPVLRAAHLPPLGRRPGSGHRGDDALRRPGSTSTSTSARARSTGTSSSAPCASSASTGSPRPVSSPGRSGPGSRRRSCWTASARNWPLEGCCPGPGRSVRSS
jgi:hypothetical protein